jgi:hypothetical protein
VVFSVAVPYCVLFSAQSQCIQSPPRRLWSHQAEVLHLEASTPIESPVILNRMRDLNLAVDKQGLALEALEARLREEDLEPRSTGRLTAAQAKFALEQVFTVLRSSFMSAGPTPLSRDDAFVIIRCVL